MQDDNSPTRLRLQGLIGKKYPKATWAVYEPLGPVATDEAYGKGVEALPQFDKADVILSLDSDFLGCDGDIADVRAFSSRRKVTGPDSKMNRLYVVENRYTVTGGMSDHRLRLPASQIGAFALALAAQIASATHDAGLDGVVKTIASPAIKFDADWIKYCAEDLVASKGKWPHRRWLAAARGCPGAGRSDQCGARQHRQDDRGSARSARNRRAPLRHWCRC
ncbi:MAG: hypothetical protein WDN28_21735 [Chthoniobacter sp.]